MKVFCVGYPGIWFICDQCGSMIGDVKPGDIYEDMYVYCPVCKSKNKLRYIGKN